MVAEPALVHADCVEHLATLEPGSVDAVCTDPPYLIDFMGSVWDHVPTGAEQQAWHRRWLDEAFRVLKPGGWLVAFGGTRTYHRLTCAVEDAGFEVRDTIQWLYGSGFPKSLNVGKAIDRHLGAERTVRVGVKPGHEDFVNRTDAHSAGGRSQGWDRPWRDDAQAVADSHLVFAPVTPEAAEWEGWGTALKPGHEPIVLARKPIRGSVAENVLEHRTGALHIAATRLGTAGERIGGGAKASGGFVKGYEPGDGFAESTEGRWPPNVVLSHSAACELVGVRSVQGEAPGGRIAYRSEEGAWKGAGGLMREGTARAVTSHSDEEGREVVEDWRCAPDCPVGELDRQSGVLRSGDAATSRTPDEDRQRNAYGADNRPPGTSMVGYGDEGGASRFFPTFRYQAKPSRSERNAGVDRNTHPTVKSVDLMRWLVKLVARPGATVLDPFMGSGTTGVACVLEGVGFVGVEREADYLAIARDRIAHATDEQSAMLPLDWIAEAQKPAARPKQPSLFDDPR